MIFASNLPSQVAVYLIRFIATSVENLPLRLAIDRQEHSTIFAKKSSISVPHGTAAPKVPSTPQPVFRSKGRPSGQNSFMAPPLIAPTNNMRQSKVSSRESAVSHSSRTLQHLGSQASPPMPRTYMQFKC